jgi:cyclase
MKRALVLVSILSFGLSLAAMRAQEPPSTPSAEAVAAAKIEKVKDNLYIITGSAAGARDVFSGGNTAVFITSSGVVLVDTKLPGWGPSILDRVKTVTDKPVVRIINTHSHGDHTGSNDFFGNMVDSIVQENTKANMSKMDAFKGDKAQFLPKRIFQTKGSIGYGKDEIQLYYFGAAHTNGDAFVVFPALRTMHVGDVFAWKALPYIDTDSGGSVTAHPKTLSNAISTIKNVDTIINGHIPVSTWKDLKEYAEFSQDFVNWSRKQLKAGKTVDRASGEYVLPARFKGYSVSVSDVASVKANLQKVYNELKK